MTAEPTNPLVDLMEALIAKQRHLQNGLEAAQDSYKLVAEHRDRLATEVSAARREFVKCWHIDPDDSLPDLVVRLRREGGEARRQTKAVTEAIETTLAGALGEAWQPDETYTSAVERLRRDLAEARAQVGELERHQATRGDDLAEQFRLGWKAGHEDQGISIPEGMVLVSENDWVILTSRACVPVPPSEQTLASIRSTLASQRQQRESGSLPAIDPAAPKPESHGPCEVCSTSWVGDITACPGCQESRERVLASTKERDDTLRDPPRRRLVETYDSSSPVGWTPVTSPGPVEVEK